MAKKAPKTGRIMRGITDAQLIEILRTHEHALDQHAAAFNRVVRELQARGYLPPPPTVTTPATTDTPAEPTEDVASAESSNDAPVQAPERTF